MEYSDVMDTDPVQWTSTQGVSLKLIFADDPPAPPAYIPPPIVAPVLPVVRHSTRSLPRGRKRKDRMEEAPLAAEPTQADLITQLGRSLEASIIPNPARKNTRVCSAGAVMLGRPVSASTSAAMPPPRRKMPKSDTSSSSVDEATTPPPDNSRFDWGRKGSVSSAAYASHLNSASASGSGSHSGSGPSSGSRSNSITIARPCTPPARNAHANTRPASVPIASSLVLPEQDIDLPPSPPTAPRPVLSVRTNSTPPPARADASMFSTRSDSASTSASTDTATTIVDHVSPITPAAPHASPPIIDLTLTPTPSPPVAPKLTQKAPQTRSAAAKAPVASPPRAAPPQARPPPVPSRSAPSQPQPPRVPVPVPARAQTIPSQSTTTTVTRASQQWPRAFPSSQTRLGLGAVGTGYAPASKPFRVPNKGKANTPLTVSALPPRGKLGFSVGSAGGASKAKPKSPAKASTSAGKLNFAPPTASPTKRKENVAGKKKDAPGRKTPTPVGRATASSSRPSASARTATSSKARADPSSEDSYFASDTSFDGDALDAVLEKWDHE